MADEDRTGKNWWGTMPGVLTALAGIITAVGGLVAILAQTGLLGGRGDGPKAAVAAPATGPATATAAAPVRNTAARIEAAPAARSPAEVLEGLRAVGFKGLAVTHRDGTVVALAAGAEISGPMLPLSNGQSVQFERIVSVDIEQPWDGSATLTLTNGQRLAAKLNDYNLYGKNELGPYRELLSNLRRIEFVR